MDTSQVRARPGEELDAWLVEACRRGDREALRLLFEAHRDRVYSIAYYFTGDEAAAKDLTQEVFLKLLTRVGRLPAGSSFSAWLFRLVHNACMDHHRRRKRRSSLVALAERGAAAADASLETEYLRRQVERSVRAAVSLLRPKLRMPILLRYVEGLSYEEIATVLGCCKGTVASRLHRGHKILARRLAHLRGLMS